MTPEPQPWQECFRLLAPKLLLFARQWLPNSADAEDVVQAAFVRFWRKHPDAQPSEYPLLYAAVRTAALDLLRSNERRGRREEVFRQDFGVGEVAYFTPALEQKEEADQVQQALQRLPAEQREVVVLRIWGELSFAEIARSLDESINTIAARYRYALEAMRRNTSPDLSYERV